MPLGQVQVPFLHSNELKSHGPCICNADPDTSTFLFKRTTAFTSRFCQSKSCHKAFDELGPLLFDLFCAKLRPKENADGSCVNASLSLVRVVILLSCTCASTETSLRRVHHYTTYRCGLFNIRWWLGDLLCNRNFVNSTCIASITLSKRATLGSQI